MGKKVAVDSSVFPLMGSEDRRPHYLKSLIISGTRAKDHSIADVINEGYKNGPGIRIRSFYNWAKNNEEFQKKLGITSGNLTVPVEIDMEALAAELPQEPGRVYEIKSAKVGTPDILYWAEQWVAEHHPDLYHTDWICDHNRNTNVVTITFEDGTTAQFTASSFDPDGDYLYVTYISYPENEEEEEEEEKEGLLKIFIYKKGSGNEVLDSFFGTTTSAGSFYPTIPFRYDNSPITGDAYKLCKKAFRKAFNQDYDKILKTINNHENVEDIDYALVVFGVPLNTKDNTSKKYIYKFLQHLMYRQPDDWHSKQIGYKGELRLDLRVRSIQKDDKTVNFRYYYNWALITEEIGTGILKEEKKEGDLWFEKVELSTEEMENFRNLENPGNIVALYWQETKNHWRKLTIYDLIHKNEIYGDNSDDTKAVDAIKDEGTSKFIVLLHEEIYHSFSLVEQTQIATFCAYLVLNYYEVHEPSFWEEWLPTIITVVVVIFTIVITVVTGGAGIGFLGPAEAVGASLGFTGTTALIVGATVNTLAALLVAYIISEVVIEVSVAAFGEKWGRVIGTIVSTILSIGISAGVNSVNIIDALTKADNLIKISQATTNAYSNYLKVSAIELNEQTQKMWEETSKEIYRYNKMTQELYGFSEIDPAHVDEYISELMERSELTERMEDFIARTLLTGSDIIEIQRQFITNFVENTITTKLP